MGGKLAIKENILKCAYEIFSEKGFLDSTVKEITEKANVNVAAINYYFGSKENLIDMVVDEYLDRLYGLFLTLKNQYSPPRQRLKIYSDNFMSLTISKIHRNIIVQAIKEESLLEKIAELLTVHASAYKIIIKEITGIEDEHTLNMKTELYCSAITYPILLNTYNIHAVQLDFRVPEIREQYIDMVLDSLFSQQ